MYSETRTDLISLLGQSVIYISQLSDIVVSLVIFKRMNKS